MSGSENVLKKLALLQVAVGGVLMIGGLIAGAALGLIDDGARYFVGSAIFVASAGAVYPWAERINKLTDRQRRYAYLLAGVGVYVMVTAL
ncbi:hypothetical protein [Salinigranum halophilum]|uniref:hypothetical protein n=1 Tax=Salinigranum halophilum TaxID=2565931 RepID=UPI0010A7F6A9|nr:hypothetical protein [Salinigranum halophilum]